MLFKGINLFILSICLSGCSSVLMSIYGSKQPKDISDNAIIKYSKKYNIPLTDSYILDTNYLPFLFSHDTTIYKAQIKNHYQPLQTLYYNKVGVLESFHINCYANGFPNFNWNRDSVLNIFPPKKQAPLDSLVSLNNQIKYLIPLPTSNKIKNKEFDYFVIVYWNRFMGRQSKRLVHFIQENCKLATDKKVRLIYVNTDNMYATSNYFNQ